MVTALMQYGTNDIKALLEQPEGENLEFNERIPDPPTLAKTISAFANTNGGTTLIGVQEGGHVVGADYRKVENIFDNALAYISNSPGIHLQGMSKNGKEFVAISVPKNNLLTLADGGAFERVGPRIQPLPVAGITRALQHPERTEIDERQFLAEAIHRLTTKIETLENFIAQSNSFRGQIRNYVIGGLVGALFGLALSMIFG